MKNSRLPLLTLSLLITLLALFLSGCTNTFHGMGQDVESAGETMQDMF